jgi:hypothetical protein
VSTPVSRTTVRMALLAVAAWLALALLLGRNADDARTLALLLIALPLPIWCCIRRDGGEGAARIDLFQPGSVLACLFYFYFVVPAFHVWYDLDYQSAWLDPTWPPAPLFQFTLLLCLLSLVAFGFGYRLTLPRARPRAISAVSERLRTEWPLSGTLAAVALLVIGVPFRLYHLALFGGLNRDVLRFLSPTYQAESGITVGGVVTFLESFFDWGALLLALRALITGKQRLLSLVVLGAAFMLAYLESGKRSAILPFLLFPAVWLHYLKRRITLGKGLLYLGVATVLMTILLFMRSIGPLLAIRGITPADVPTDITAAPARFYLNSPELAVFDMTVLAVADREPLLREIGGVFRGGLEYNLAPAAYIIPRVLWPGKPAFQDLGQVFFQHAVGGREDVGFSVGIVGGLYLFGGVVGVLFGMVAVGVVFRLAYEWLRPWSGDLRRVFLYGIALWMAFHFLRFGTLGSPIMYFWQFELPGVIAALVALKVRPSTAA